MLFSKRLSDLSDLVGRLQGLEEQQLRLTVDLQLARQVKSRKKRFS